MKILKWLLVLQILVNLIGALGPELGFDALWYHLTEAKLFLAHHSLAPIPGNLLYWSGLPRLGETIYALSLAISPALPKLIHWGFGVWCVWLVYRLGGMAAALLFYSTLLVGWLSTSAYIDLIMTAWLLAAVYYRRLKRIIFLILAGATKLPALVYGLAITLIPWGILGILPFALINYHSTGNFFYPFRENFGFEHEWFFNGFIYWLSRPLRLFFDPAYRVGPIILIIFIIGYKHYKYCRIALLSFLLWFLMPGTDFGRFALFPLALLSLSAVKPSRLITALIIFQAVVGISVRAYANAKYLPVIFGQQTQADFLTKNLKFYFGDWYDIDGWFAKNIKSTDKVLVYNLHNLYYVDFPYDHATWKNPVTRYTHI
ncbi:MAG: hypothetical protein NTZ93_00440, partial [Candidatus Beckwithbacteria bacterium]|nr:hypothetical protein [Candidatus Beckwithbacteria bacterium]